MANQLKSPEKIYGLHFTRAEIRDAVRHNRLLTLDLETSRACNLRCIYCYANSGRKRENELSLTELRGVVDQAIRLGARVVTVIGGGEPLLYPRIRELLDYISRRPVQQNLFTNGTLITPAVARFLARRRISVVVKFNSLRPAVQDRLAGARGTFRRIHRGIAALIAAGYTRNPELALGLETIICKQNYGELESMWRYARDRGMRPYFEVITFQGRAKQRRLNVTRPQLRQIFNRLLAIDQREYGFTWNPHPPIAGLSCQRHFYNLLVTSNGFVHPCTGVDISVGNIRHQTLAEIIAFSPVIRALRQVDRLIKEPCRSCGYHDECYGCRGFAYHYCGDFLAADPTCWIGRGRPA